MRFDKCQNDVNTPLFQSMSLFQHLVGLSHTGGRANKYFQPPALGALDQLEYVFSNSVLLQNNQFISARSISSSLFLQRRTATRHQIASTTPNGQAPWRNP